MWKPTVTTVLTVESRAINSTESGSVLQLVANNAFQSEFFAARTGSRERENEIMRETHAEEVREKKSLSGGPVLPIDSPVDVLLCT